MEGEGTSDNILTPEQEEEWRRFEKVKKRAINYKLASNEPAFQDMMMDLGLFCRARESCVALDKNGKVDVHMTFVLEGRREVYQRILDHCNLTSKELYALFTGRQFNPGVNYDDRS